MITRLRTTRDETVRLTQLTATRNILSGMWVALALCGLALVGYEVASGQWRATPVLSGSMRPGLQPGDVVITHRVPVSDLLVRDVIVFHPPDEADRLTVHRIVKMERRGGTTVVTTWGDANSVRDPAVSSLDGTTAYRVERIVPVLGYPAMWLQTGDLGMLAIALGVLLMAVAGAVILRPDKPTTAADPADSDDRLAAKREDGTAEEEQQASTIREPENAADDSGGPVEEPADSLESPAR